MSYKIRKLPDEVDFETLPVAKIIDYPLERRDYKPFAQACLCLAGNGLAVRLWAFEVSPGPQSELRACLSLPKAGGVLHISVMPPASAAEARNRVRTWIAGEGAPRLLEPIRTRAHNGEDLQGVYWGEDVFLAGDRLNLAGLRPGELLYGNFYKQSAAPEKEHRGSFYPADWSGDPFAGASLGEMEIVAF